jgi:hypothetical protein
MTDHRFILMTASGALALETITGIIVFGVATVSAVCGMIAGQA